MPDKAKAIEPSEIITGRDDTIHRQMVRANPWLRLTGRFFDYSLFFAILYLIAKPFGWLPFGRIIPFEYFIWIFFETLLLTFWGSTPGKWLVGTKLKKDYTNRFTFSQALKRSFNVWFRGIGMGIPFINLLCMATAYYRINLLGQTSWDREEDIHVAHLPVARWRIYFAAAFALIGMIFYSFCKKHWL